jgi:hypothetical protein
MRHVLLPGAIVPGTRRVVHATAAARLVAFASGALGLMSGPPVHSRRHSKSGRGRSSCRRAPGPGSGRTGTDGQEFPQAQLRPGMDDVRNGWNTAPACVLGTCGARRRFGLGRLGRRRACSCRSGRLSPRHCALDTRRNAAIVHPARGSLWICGQRKGVAHKSTGPASSSQHQFVCLETVGFRPRPAARRRLSAWAVARRHG